MTSLQLLVIQKTEITEAGAMGLKRGPAQARHRQRSLAEEEVTPPRTPIPSRPMICRIATPLRPPPRRMLRLRSRRSGPGSAAASRADGPGEGSRRREGRVEVQAAGVFFGGAAGSKRRRAELELDQKTMRFAYDKVGKKSPEVDESARTALDLLSRLQTNQVKPTTMHWEAFEHARKAVEAGCDDPLVLYAYAFSTGGRANYSVADFDRRMAVAAEAIRESQYPAMSARDGADERGLSAVGQQGLRAEPDEGASLRRGRSQGARRRPQGREESVRAAALSRSGGNALSPPCGATRRTRWRRSNRSTRCSPT